jgi:cytochrome b pre-mRNA-processing protein 3
MIFGLFRGNASRKLVSRLFGEIVEAARDPLLFTDYGIEDTFDGRFESLVLHAALVLRRLDGLPSAGPEIAQDLVDMLFRQFDIALREIGISDTRVPKKMKALAEAYAGRAKAYGDALAQGGEAQLALSRALARNVYAGRQNGEPLARYVIQLDARLAQANLVDFADGRIAFAGPVTLGE